LSVKVTSRNVDGVTVIDLDGRITLGEGSAKLRDSVRETLDSGHAQILINLAGVTYMDSSGLGELVSGYRAAKSQGGELKLTNVTKRINDVLQVTKLCTVFNVHDNESDAVASFRR
jgi:anti-sigma B factor antagonist